MATVKYVKGLNEYMRLLIRIRKLKTKQAIQKQYSENENYNLHTENIVLLAQKFGSATDKANAKKAFLQLENSNTGTNESSRKIARTINKKLFPKLKTVTKVAPAKKKAVKSKYKVGQLVKMFNDEPPLKIVALNDFGDKITYDLKSNDKKIDRRNILETKIKMATRKTPAKRTAKKKAVKSKTNTLKSEFKALGIKLPHGYEVVKRAPKKKKATAKKKLVKKVAPKKAVAKKTSTKKPSAKQLAARKAFAKMARAKKKK